MSARLRNWALERRHEEAGPSLIGPARSLWDPQRVAGVDEPLLDLGDEES